MIWQPGEKISNRWWLSSPSDSDDEAWFVECESGSLGETAQRVDSKYGVRPALKLDLSKVTGNRAICE